MKSLPWADSHNYRIIYDEQRVRVRVPDMTKFDHRQMIDAFKGKGLPSVAIVEFKEFVPLPQAAAEKRDAILESLLDFQGEWHGYNKGQKFWLTIAGDTIRLHTVYSGFWSTSTTRIHDAGEGWLHFGNDLAHPHELRFQRQDNAWLVQIAYPNTYHGEYKMLSPEDDDES